MPKLWQGASWMGCIGVQVAGVACRSGHGLCSQSECSLWLMAASSISENKGIERIQLASVPDLYLLLCLWS